MHKYTCGAVGFRKDGKWVELMGEERIEALRKFYRREDLDGLIPFVTGYGEVKWEKVDWHSCGEKVTGGEI